MARGHGMAWRGAERGPICPPSSSSSTPAGGAVTGAMCCPSGRGRRAGDRDDPELAERRLDLRDLDAVADALGAGLTPGDGDGPPGVGLGDRADPERSAVSASFSVSPQTTLVGLATTIFVNSGIAEPVDCR